MCRIMESVEPANAFRAKGKSRARGGKPTLSDADDLLSWGRAYNVLQYENRTVVFNKL